MRNMIKRTMLCCLASFTVLLCACAYDTASLRIDKSLPPEKLARYSDSFDSLREEIWEKDGYIFNESLRTPFKLADVGVEGGAFRVTTKTGCFSNGGISSKFYIRGDFDIQVNCTVYFMKNNDDIDPTVFFGAIDKTADLEDDKMENVIFGLSKIGKNPVFIYGGFFEKGNYKQRFSKKIGDSFNGTFRILRIGNQVTLLYRTVEEIEWQKACSFFRPRNDIIVLLKAKNFVDKSNFITAKSAFTAQFDNFKVNAAEEIIEEEI
jgi:hypothetical protein